MRCLFTRWAISRAADSGPGLSDRARAHVDQCVDCEAFERRVEWLGRSLKRSGDLAPTPPKRARFPRHLAIAGLVTAATVAVVIVVGGDNGPSPLPAEPVVADSTAPPPVEREPAIDVGALATDAEQGIRYMLRVSGLPEP